MTVAQNNKPTAPTIAIQVSDKHVEDFLLATQPCFVHFPAEMRRQVREALQARVERGELTEKHFADFAHHADIERALRSGAGL